MKLLVNVMRVAALGVGTLGAALLVSCGGGSLVSTFQPTRLLVFGDEISVIQDVNSDGNGRKYSVNALKTDNLTLDCIANPNWVQYLSSAYGLVLPSCNPNAVIGPANRIYAQPGATVTDVTAQIDQHLATSTFAGGDLVTLLAGGNDIIAAYTQFPGVAEDQLRAGLEAKGEALAAQVNRIANAGGKVLIATVPDLGLSPYAITEETANAGRAALLSRLTGYFNNRVRRDIINDGRRIGLLLTDELVQVLVKYPSNYGLTNVTTPVCDPALAVTVDQCTTLTLVSGGSASTYLWADSRNMSPAGHLHLGEAAVNRARNNPF